MRTAALVLVFVFSATLSPVASAGGTCREYTLYDNDTGERVEGCAPVDVEGTGGKPVQVVPAMKKRNRFGWKIAELSRSDLLSRMSLRPGDVILSLNGYDMASQKTPDIIANILGGDERLVITVGKKPRPVMGKKSKTTVMEVSDSGRGITLNTIPDGSFFETIGLQPGDRVKSIGGRPVKNVKMLNILVEDAQKMPEVHVIVIRQGQEIDIVVKTE